MIKKKSLKIDIIRLFFVTLIIFILNVYLNKAYALDEFIENYENENYIQAKYEVVRNSTLNCMELDFAEGMGELEDYTTYTEIDPNNHITINSATQITHLVYRNEDAYLYDDKGANHFDYSIGFTHQFDFKSTFGDLYNNGMIWSLANEIDDWSGLNKTENLNVNTYRSDGIPHRLYLHNNLIQDWCDTVLANTWYYLTITLFPNGTLSCWIYTDSERTSLHDKLSIEIENQGVKTRYIYACQTNNKGGLARVYTNNMQNLDLGEGAGYENFGYYYSKNILNYVNGSSIVLLTNATIGLDEITVEFSNDNSTWVNHNGSPEGDELKSGFESIDLRDLNYSSNLYMRFNFSDIGVDSTPRLYQFRLITSANVTISNGEPDESLSALLIVGLITGLVLGVGIYISKK